MDYNDYVDYIVVDGENDICTISFPVEWAYMSVKNLDSGSYYFTGYDNSVTLEAPDDDGTGNQGYLGNIEIDLFPLGTPFSFYAVDAAYGGRFLDMSNIPGGATFTMVMSYGIMVESAYENMTPYYTRFTRGDIYSSGLTATKVDVTYSANDTNTLQYISVTGDFEELANGWTCGFRGRWDMTEEVIFSFALERLEVTFSISALYRMQEKMDETNELLSVVVAKLLEEGLLLEDILGEEIKQSSWLEKIWNAIIALGDKIAALPEAIANGVSEGVADLFIPSEQKIQEVTDKADELVEEHLGGVAQAGKVVTEVAAAFTEQTTQETITFPAVTLTFSGVPWTFGGWEVDVIPDGFEFLFDALAFLIDVVATLAFVNGMKTRWDKIMEG